MFCLPCGSKGETLPIAAAIEHLPVSVNGSARAFPPPIPARLARAPAINPVAKFQDLRAYGHDPKQEKPGGNPPSGQKNPELPCLVLFTPRSKQFHNPSSGDETNTENQSWKCACN